MIAVIHRGEKFKEMLEQFQQKRAEFISQEIRYFDAETLFACWKPFGTIVTNLCILQGWRYDKVGGGAI